MTAILFDYILYWPMIEIKICLGGENDILKSFSIIYHLQFLYLYIFPFSSILLSQPCEFAKKKKKNSFLSITVVFNELVVIIGKNSVSF